MPTTITTPGGRSALDIGNEFDGAMKTIASRLRRLPASEEGLAYAAELKALATGLVEVCVADADEAEGTGKLVEGPEALAAAEAALEAARETLKADVDRFLSMDVAQLRAAQPQVPSPQTASAGVSVRIPQSFGTG